MGLLAEHVKDNPRFIVSDRGMSFCDHDSSSSESELGDIIGDC